MLNQASYVDIQELYSKQVHEQKIKKMFNSKFEIENVHSMIVLVSA